MSSFPSFKPVQIANKWNKNNFVNKDNEYDNKQNQCKTIENFRNIKSYKHDNANKNLLQINKVQTEKRYLSTETQRHRTLNRISPNLNNSQLRPIGNLKDWRVSPMPELKPLKLQKKPFQLFRIKRKKAPKNTQMVKEDSEKSIQFNFNLIQTEII